MERGTPPRLCAPDLQKIYSAKEVEKRCYLVKGIKLAFVGVCLGLLGITMQPDASLISVVCALIGVAVAVVGCFVKDK